MSLRLIRSEIFLLSMSLMVLMSFMSNDAFAQQSETALEWRVQKLEDYVQTIEPAINELSNNLNDGIADYTKRLESSLESFSERLQINLDERLNSVNQRRIVLNPYSNAYQSIETNTGTFLIAVDRVEVLENETFLYLKIGNPNYADYKDFELQLRWGRKWTQGFQTTYDQWRKSLNGSKYNFEGELKKGKWNEVVADIGPVEGGQIGYLEVEMYVASVELQAN